MSNIKTDKQLQKELAALQETFYWSAGSENVDGLSNRFIAESVIPSQQNMIEKAESIRIEAKSKKLKNAALDFIERVKISLSLAQQAIN